MLRDCECGGGVFCRYRKPYKIYKKIIHKLAHLLGCNYGLPDSFYEGERLMMSFKCSGCGKRSGIHCVDKIVDRELKN